jgi:hypothetical protein
VNDTLRRALFEVQLSDGDVATRLGVDPKTVQRWLEGRLPYARYRDQLARLLGLDEGEIWPEVRASRPEQSMPTELAGVYPRRNLIPQDAWLSMFAGAQNQIDLVAYSAGFLVEDSRFLQVLSVKVSQGVRIAAALGDPGRLDLARVSAAKDDHESTLDSIVHSISGLRSLVAAGGLELRLHDVLLYNSLYRVDNQILVHQHLYGIAAERTPVYHFYKSEQEEMFDFYMSSFRRIWKEAVPAP